ncbi:unnamed protein product [Nesidiocoris tenuis]|uniref:Uncharacterized protein n=1 Tax=Nesidiocoris tenuis TaxID=355587 RepID=A0A6H5H6S5_9HEMI|nr:unnamed protein product [Nesidiocoris tenuis]
MYAMTGLYSEHAAPEGEETEGAGPSAADTPIPVHPTSHVKCHSRNPSSGIVDKCCDNGYRFSHIHDTTFRRRAAHEQCGREYESGQYLQDGVCPTAGHGSRTTFLRYSSLDVEASLQPHLRCHLPGRLHGTGYSFRSVNEEERSFALGMQFVIFRLFGYIPAPILFGNLIDSTCLFWKSTCGEKGGRCLLYDIEQFRYNITYLSEMQCRSFRFPLKSGIKISTQNLED